MDSSSTSFLFRDSTDIDNASDDSSSVSSAGDGELKIESLTAKGVKRLCSELLELKKASDDDFHQTLYFNYSAFVRIFEQVGGIQNELIRLKEHFSNQRVLVKDLADIMYLEILLESSTGSTTEESLDDEQSPLDKLEAHTNVVSETLDILLSEHRLDEAMVILELEDITFKMMCLEEKPLPQSLMVYDFALSERKTKLAYQFARVADHPRVGAPEFQKALSGLCRLGDSPCATQLLLKFYRSRLENGVHDLRCSESSLNKTHIKELAKFVFSMISQAARGFVLLYGEDCSYASELIQWAHEETAAFACYFHNFVKSISEVNGGFSAVVSAMQHSIAYCSILEAQSIVLCPYLVKITHPYMEEVLKMHIDHYKKAIGVFTAADDWVLAKYLMSEIVEEESSPLISGDKMEYCLLTNSGRKLVTLLQEVSNEFFPLVIFQMETSIFGGLLELFKEYINNLERAIPSKEDVLDRSDFGTVLAHTLSQQLSLLANASDVVHIVSTSIERIFKELENSECQLITNTATESFHAELNNCIFSIQDVANQVRTVFHERFIRRVMSPEGGPIFSGEYYHAGQEVSNSFNVLMPSAAFQVLFLELRQLEKVGKEIFIEVDWLVEDILRELIKAFLVWLETNQDLWTLTDESSDFHKIYGFGQFVLDMHFLVEITRFGGYYSDNLVDASLALMSRMEATFLSAGLDPHRDLLADDWATNVATEAIQKLLHTEKSETPQIDLKLSTLEEDPDKYFSDSTEDIKSFLEDSPDSDDRLNLNASEAAVTVIPDTQILENNAYAEPVCYPYEEDISYDKGPSSSMDLSIQSEAGTEDLNADNDSVGLLEETEEREELEIESPVDYCTGF